MATTTVRQQPSPIAPPLVIPIEIAGSVFLVAFLGGVLGRLSAVASNGSFDTVGIVAVSAWSGSIWP